MKRIVLVNFVTLLFSFSTNAQNLDDLESYTVQEFYEKVELETGSLDEDGDDIEYVFVETNINLSEGLYEIELSDGPGELYEIHGTDLFVTFIGYYGYAGYGEECIMKVSGSYYGSVTIYKLD